MFSPFRDEKNVDNVQNSKGIYDKKENKPPLMPKLRGVPERVSLPGEHPEHDDEKYPKVFSNQCFHKKQYNVSRTAHQEHEPISPAPC